MGLRPLRHGTSRRLAAAVAVCLLVTACGGADTPSEDLQATPTAPETADAEEASADNVEDTTDGDTSRPVPVATVTVYDDAAELALAAATNDFGPANDGDAIAVGDTVRTDESGFAQLDFVDGSLARLDNATSLTVTALGDVGTPTVELDLDVGRVWNRVAELEGEASYRVTTDVGTAAVRGTVFVVWVRVDGSTLVVVDEGEVVFTTTDGEEFVLVGGESLEFGPDGATTGPGPTSDGFASESFVQRNRTLDATGQDPGATVGTADPTLAGDYLVTYRMTTPPEVDTQLTADTYDGVDPYVAVQASSFNGLPTEVGGSAEAVWTIGDDGLVVADVPPRVTELLATGPSSFRGGFERRDVGPVENCENTPNVQTNLTTIEVERSDDTVVAFTGTQVDGSYIEDAGNCLNLRHTTVWELSAERIGPPDESRLARFRG